MTRHRAAAPEVDRAPAPAARGHEHDLLLVDSDEDLQTSVTSFLDEGRGDGDLLAAAVPAELGDRLRVAVADTELQTVDLHRFRALREPDAIIVARRLLAEATATPARRLRIVGLVHEAGDRRWQERERAEAAHNTIFAGKPVTALCVYDRRRLTPAALTAALATHPHVRTAHGRRPNALFREPVAHLRGLPLPHEPLQDTPPVFAVEDASSLPELRRLLAAALRGRAGDRDVEEDFHLAVSELAANAFRHGSRPVAARLWAGPGRLVATISDGGTRFDDPLAGYLPAHGDDRSRGGMGLWLARKLCDHVDLQRTPTGLTVRVATATDTGTGTGTG